MKTKTQKITSVNFVPPLIKPWSYDPQVVRDTVASDHRRGRGGRRAGEAQARPDGQPAATRADGDREVRPTKPKKQAVMDRPATDPDANTSDLASVCSVRLSGGPTPWRRGPRTGTIPEVRTALEY